MLHSPVPHLFAVHFRVVGESILDSPLDYSLRIDLSVRFRDYSPVNAAWRILAGSPVIFGRLGSKFYLLCRKPLIQTLILPNLTTRSEVMELAAFRQSQVVVRGGEVENFRLYGIELRELLALGNHAPDVVLTVSGVELGILRDNLFLDEFVEVHKSSVCFVNLSNIRIPFAKWMVFLTF